MNTTKEQMITLVQADIEETQAHLNWLYQTLDHLQGIVVPTPVVEPEDYKPEPRTRPGETRAKVLELASRHRILNSTVIHDEIRISKGAASWQLRNLVQRGELRQIGVGQYTKVIRPLLAGVDPVDLHYISVQ